MNNGKYTPTQKRILEVLKDGLPHPREEVVGCIADELAQSNAIRVHLTLLRRKLNPIGLHITIEYVRMKMHYRLVRLLTSADTGVI